MYAKKLHILWVSLMSCLDEKQKEYVLCHFCNGLAEASNGVPGVVNYHCLNNPSHNWQQKNYAELDRKAYTDVRAL
jgi:hypothetical protein